MKERADAYIFHLSLIQKYRSSNLEKHGRIAKSNPKKQVVQKRKLRFEISLLDFQRILITFLS